MTSPKDASIVAKITGTILCGNDRFHCPNAQVTDILHPEMSDEFSVRLACKVCGYEGEERWNTVLSNAQRIENLFVPSRKLALIDELVGKATKEKEQ